MSFVIAEGSLVRCQTSSCQGLVRVEDGDEILDHLSMYRCHYCSGRSGCKTCLECNGMYFDSTDDYFCSICAEEGFNPSSEIYNTTEKNMTMFIASGSKLLCQKPGCSAIVEVEEEGELCMIDTFADFRCSECNTEPTPKPEFCECCREADTINNIKWTHNPFHLAMNNTYVYGWWCQDCLDTYAMNI